MFHRKATHEHPHSVNIFLSGSFRFWASAAASTTAAGPSTTSALARLARRRPHKGKVHLNGLVQKLLAVRSFDGSLGLSKRGVFNKDVALGLG
jgi:hypothetical protein